MRMLIAILTAVFILSAALPAVGSAAVCWQNAAGDSRCVTDPPPAPSCVPSVRVPVC